LSGALAKAQIIFVGLQPGQPLPMPHGVFLREEPAPDFIEAGDAFDDRNADFLVQQSDLDGVLIAREYFHLSHGDRRGALVLGGEPPRE
jgi:hypothetical protein